MAQTTTLDPPETAQNLPTDGGRPYAEPGTRGKTNTQPVGFGERRKQMADQKGEPPAETKDSPEKEQEGFWEFVRSLDDKDWETHVAYLWRWEPVLDVTKGGIEKKYVMVYNSTFTIDSVKQEQGSGQYEIRLNKYIPAKRNDSTIRRVVFTILDQKFPPKIDLGDWIDHPRNKKWAWMKRAATPSSLDPNNPIALMSFVRDVIRTERPDNRGNGENALVAAVVNQLPALLKQNNEGNDPAKFMTAILSIIDELEKRRAPVVSAGPDPILMKMIDNAREDAKAAREEALELRKQIFALLAKPHETPAAAVDVNKQIEGWSKAMESMSSLMASVGANAAPREWWQEMLANLSEGVGPVLGPLAAAYMTRPREAKPPGGVMPVAPTRRPAAAPPAPAPAPAATATPGTEQPPPAPTAAAQPEQPAPTVEVLPAVTVSEMDQFRIMQIVGLARLAAMAIELSTSGDDFADKLCYKHGGDTYDKIIALPKEELINQLKSIPEAWQFLAPYEDQLPTFIDEFYAFSEQDEGGEPDEPAPKPKKAAAAAATITVETETKKAKGGKKK